MGIEAGGKNKTGISNQCPLSESQGLVSRISPPPRSTKEGFCALPLRFPHPLPLSVSKAPTVYPVPSPMPVALCLHLIFPEEADPSSIYLLMLVPGTDRVSKKYCRTHLFLTD